MRIPTNRPPTHPGEMLDEEFLKPLGLSQSELAQRLGVPFQRVNRIINKKQAVTIDTALRLSALLGTTPQLWLDLQHGYDLYQAVHSKEARQIEKSVQPLIASEGLGRHRTTKTRSS